MKQYKIFISHSWAYGDAYDKLKGMLDGAPRFSYSDYSVPKNDPIHNAPDVAKLKAAIEAKMRFCDVVVILAGVYATYSKWINREMALAHAYQTPKPILAIQPWGAEKTSKVVKDSADKVVAWNTNSIVAGIRELA